MAAGRTVKRGHGTVSTFRLLLNDQYCGRVQRIDRSINQPVCNYIPSHPLSGLAEAPTVTELLHSSTCHFRSQFIAWLEEHEVSTRDPIEFAQDLGFATIIRLDRVGRENNIRTLSGNAIASNSPTNKPALIPWDLRYLRPTSTRDQLMSYPRIGVPGEVQTRRYLLECGRFPGSRF